MNAIYVMNSILLKTLLCENRTSLPGKVGKPVIMTVEISFMFAPVYYFVDGRKENPSLGSKRGLPHNIT